MRLIEYFDRIQIPHWGNIVSRSQATKEQKIHFYELYI